MAQEQLSGKSPRAHSSQRFWPAAIAVGVPLMMGLRRWDVGPGCWDGHAKTRFDGTSSP